GSSLAGFLAKQGQRVIVLEKDVFPRFHIGESLLPMTIPALQELGLDLAREPYALKKPGALFYDEGSHESLRIDFAHALQGSFPYAYQVERQYFDHALAKRAQALGAEIHFGTTVDSWQEHEDGVEVRGDFGTCRAKILVDATGQQAIIGRKNRSVQPLERFGLCASFSTFGRVESELAKSAVGNGDIVIFMCDMGWAWLIPLTGERVSAGLVEKKPRAGTTAEEMLNRCIESSEYLTQFFAGSERIAPFRRISNYSYYNLAPSTARSVSVGDARAFLDPIFSSGVTIAVLCARMLAREIGAALGEGRGMLLDDYWKRCEIAYTTFDRLIERFYRPEWVRNIFFASGAEDRLVREFTSILAGDVWREDNDIQQKFLKTRPRTGWGSEAAAR
ncbi:MAG: NAD(P)/FAD-dependent oxidoreductase, partial [Planctomycetota bacterium]